MPRRGDRCRGALDRGPHLQARSARREVGGLVLHHHRYRDEGVRRESEDDGDEVPRSVLAPIEGEDGSEGRPRIPQAAARDDKAPPRAPLNKQGHGPAGLPDEFEESTAKAMFVT